MAKLTKTQTFILKAAAVSPTGSVGFYAGDRKGTRIARTDDLGRPWIVAYGSPEWFLCARKLLEKSNEPHVYALTDAGRAAFASDREASRG
jgi:hypothetical protein